MFNFFKKPTKGKSKLQLQNQTKCSGDPDCPMCQVSDEVMKTFTTEEKSKEATNE